MFACSLLTLVSAMVNAEATTELRMENFCSEVGFSVVMKMVSCRTDSGRDCRESLIK